MDGIIGSLSNPYRYDEYLDMEYYGRWYGGWVILNSNEIAYIRRDGTIEKDNGYILGSVNNPFSEISYYEMMNMKIWPGGYVQHGTTNDTIEYHRSYEEQKAACGCGCECGCGSDGGIGGGTGSGDCYVHAGQEEIIAVESRKVIVRLLWNSGFPRKIPFSWVLARVDVKSPFKLVSNTLSAQWAEEGYTVILSGSVIYKNSNGNISDPHTLISPDFEIPEEYRDTTE